MANLKALHKRAVQDLARQYRLVMNRSAEGVYVYLDDEHKACNEKLARLFGYSKAEWERKSPFLDNFVAPESRDDVSDGYWRFIRKARVPRNLEFEGLRRDGSRFMAHLMEFPVSYKGRLFSIGFVHEAKSQGKKKGSR